MQFTNFKYSSNNMSKRDYHIQNNLNMVFENEKIYSEEIRQLFPEKVNNSIKSTQKFFNTRQIKLDELKKLDRQSDIQVVYDDTADAAFFLQQKGFNPVLLNMASDITPGGGWRKGSVAQEESLFYRSLYYLALENKNYYPLSTYSVIYTPDVFFFRTKQLDGYRVLPYEECSFLSCLAVAAVRKPLLKDDGEYVSEEDSEVMIEKIRSMFKIALLKGHDSIVVGAFGCGAFGNNPKKVAELFKQVIPEFKDYFRKIVFAILDYNGSTNFQTFKSVLYN